ncbi:MAG: CvpA family protein [Lachnotalea sp.]
MNWLLIAVAVFLLLSALNGYRLGFVKKLFTTVSFIITIVAASVMAPHVSEFLENYTSVYSTIKENTSSVIEVGYEDNNESQDKAVDDTKMPTIIKNFLLESKRGESITANITDYISTKLADTIINAISFAISFVVITLVLRTTLFTLDIIANLPIIKGINQYAGLILGAGEGIVIVWLLFLVLAIMVNTEVGIILNKYIEDSAFLSFIYNNNYFFKLF